VIYINTAASSKNFSGAVAGKKEDFCKGSFARTSFTLFEFCFYFIFACIVLSKIQKNSFLLVVFTCLLLVLLE
jgi:hypothetical protein